MNVFVYDYVVSGHKADRSLSSRFVITPESLVNLRACAHTYGRGDLSLLRSLVERSY